MIVFLLIVIVAILLMGSSAFIGAVGIILGCIAGLAALALLMDLWAGLSTATHWTLGMAGAAGVIALWVWQQRGFATLSNWRRETALATW